MGKTYGLENVPVIVSRAIRKTELGITEVRSDVPGQGMTEIPREDAFMIGIQLRDFLRHEYFEDRRFPPMHDLHVGDTCVYDLRRGVGANLDKPFHSVHMYLPCAALDAITEDLHSPPIRELLYTPGKGVDDPVFQRIFEMMAANLDGNVRVRMLAHEAGLSVSQFSRAFRFTATGTTRLHPAEKILGRERID